MGKLGIIDEGAYEDISLCSKTPATWIQFFILLKLYTGRSISPGFKETKDWLTFVLGAKIEC